MRFGTIALLLIALGLILFMAGCTKSDQNQNQNESEKALPGYTIYFYYSPLCPWCRMVKPYVQLLKNETANFSQLSIIMCDARKLQSCPDNASYIAKEVKLRGIPTAVIVNGTSGKIDEVYVGADKVAKLGEFLVKHGYNVTAYYSIGGLNYTVKDCISCHVKKNLKPPSTYSCNACCHEEN